MDRGAIVKNRSRFIPVVLAVVCLLAGPFDGASAGESRNRALERVLAGGVFSAAEGARIQRSFASAVQAGVEEREALSIVESCVDGEFDVAQTQRVLSIAAQLALEHLPVESYLAKIEEGVSKRVSPERVVQAAERRGLALNKARLILNGLVLDGVSVEDRDELLPDLAAALEAGRPEREAREIVTEALQAGESLGAVRRRLFP